MLTRLGPYPTEEKYIEPDTPVSRHHTKEKYIEPDTPVSRHHTKEKYVEPDTPVSRYHTGTAGSLASRQSTGAADCLSAVSGRPSPHAVVKIAEATYPKIFPWRLEYNCPVHEHWNIVHTGMLIPECQQIYVCSDNCLRGVIMTADEMDAAQRISSVMPTEREVVSGQLEQVTIEGVSDVIRRLPKRPRAALVFLVCMHHFIGADSRYIFGQLRERFPDIDIMPCFMDPIMQKVSLTPEQKQRRSMMAVLPDLPRNQHTVSILGDNLRLPESSDISRLFAARGIVVKQVMDCRTYDDYLAMGDSFLLLTRSALSVYGVQSLAQKNVRRAVYLPPVALDSQIEESLRKLMAVVEDEAGAADNPAAAVADKQAAAAADNPEAAGAADKTAAGAADNPEAAAAVKQAAGTADNPEAAAAADKQAAGAADNPEAAAVADKQAAGAADNPEAAAAADKQAAGAADGSAPDSLSCFFSEEKQQTKSAFAKVKEEIGDAEIWMDYIAFPRPLSFARRLLEEKFRVTRVCMDGVSPEEEEDFRYLQKNFPELEIQSTSHVEAREKAMVRKERSEKILALGPKAAFFADTPYFVNWIEYDGNWGWDGLRKLASSMVDAWNHPKDTRDLVQRKGLGLPSEVEKAQLDGTVTGGQAVVPAARALAGGGQAVVPAAGALAAEGQASQKEGGV